MSNTLKHIEKIKERIQNSKDLSEEEINNSMRLIEEWYAEDKAWGTFLAELAKISPKIESILVELGLI